MLLDVCQKNGNNVILMSSFGGFFGSSFDGIQATALQMTAVSLSQQSRNFLPLTVAMMICLILLINVSFKIIDAQGIWFTASSVLCAMIAGLYLLVLNECNAQQQRQVLNQSLLALYLFSVGIYLLVNLPAAPNLRDNIAYQIVFEDIPRKFFAATLAFGLCFYLPHAYLASKKGMLRSPKYNLLLALSSGFLFFSMDFWLLFSDPDAASFTQIYCYSLMVCLGLLLLIGGSYSLWCWWRKYPKERAVRQVATYFLSPLYYYLIGFAVTILMICLACEYRIISVTNGWTLSASGLLFPLILMVGNLVGELYGFKANLRLLAILLLSEWAFDLLLMIAVVLPSPDSFNINFFYDFMMPRRIPATTLTLVLALGSNAWLLEKLKHGAFGNQRALRIIIANVLGNSLLCLVNYNLLFAGVYPYEQIWTLVFSSWVYKLFITLVSLPLILWLSQSIPIQPRLLQKSV